MYTINKNGNMADYKILSQQEYFKKGLELFGSDSSQWVFVCPVCEKEQNFWNFAKAGFKHAIIQSNRACVHGCKITHRDFATVVLRPGASVEVFEFGKTTKYTGDRQSSEAAKKYLISQRNHAKNGIMPSDFIIASQARKSGRTFREVKRQHVERIAAKRQRAKEARAAKHREAKEEIKKIKYILPDVKPNNKPIGKRLSEKPITNQMKDIVKTVEARKSRSIDEQIKAAQNV